MKPSRPALTAMRVPCSVRTADRMSPPGTGTHAATGRSSGSGRHRRKRQRLPPCVGHQFLIRRFKRLPGLPPPTTGGRTQTTRHFQHGISTAPPTAQVEDAWRRRHATSALLSAFSLPTMTGRKMRWDRPHIDPLTRHPWRPDGEPLPSQRLRSRKKRPVGNCLRCHAPFTSGTTYRWRRSPRRGWEHLSCPPASGNRGVCPSCFEVRSATGTCRCT